MLEYFPQDKSNYGPWIAATTDVTEDLFDTPEKLLLEHMLVLDKNKKVNGNNSANGSIFEICVYDYCRRLMNNEGWYDVEIGHRKKIHFDGGMSWIEADIWLPGVIIGLKTSYRERWALEDRNHIIVKYVMGGFDRAEGFGSKEVPLLISLFFREHKYDSVDKTYKESKKFTGKFYVPPVVGAVSVFMLPEMYRIGRVIVEAMGNMR